MIGADEGGEGWIDPYGIVRPNRPPAGWWQASDGRWYPPRPEPPPSRSAHPPPRPAPLPPGPGPGGRSGRTALIIAGAAFVVLIGGCAGLGYLVAQVPPPETTTTVPSTTGTTRPADGDPAEVADVSGCTPLPDDPDNYHLLDVVNSASETVSYDLTVAFYDADGVNVGTTNHIVSNLRPGERSIEPYTVGPDKWRSCAVRRVDRYRSPSDPAALARAACVITDTSDFFDEVDGTMTVTNDGSTDIAYDGFVAFVDGDGVRRSSAAASFDLIGPGETARGDVTGDLGYDGELSCVVVGAEERQLA